METNVFVIKTYLEKIVFLVQRQEIGTSPEMNAFVQLLKLFGPAQTVNVQQGFMATIVFPVQRQGFGMPKKSNVFARTH